jgi:hypothetical protein
MSKMTWIKILLPLVVFGTMAFFVSKWNVSLPPPKKIAPAKPQMLIDVIMPAYARAEQTDLNLYKRDPEAYADRFNRNNELYNRSISLVCEDQVKAGDTVQLKYFHQYDPPQETHWDLVSVKPPFYESVENGQYQYLEYLKGVVRVVVN